jgi:hypothetical protein
MGESAQVEIVAARYRRARSESIRLALVAMWEMWELRPTVTTRKREANLLRSAQTHPDRQRELGVRSAVAWPIFRDHEWAKTVIVAQALVAFPVYEPGDGYDLARSIATRIWAMNGGCCFVSVRFWSDWQAYPRADEGEWANGLGELGQVFTFWEPHRAVFAAEARAAPN